MSHHSPEAISPIRWTVKKAARRACGWIGRGRTIWRQREEIHVLTYHCFEKRLRAPFSVDPHQFEEQMSWLAERRLAVNLDALKQCLAGEMICRRRTVLVTIDDGDETVYSRAFPILQRYRIPSVLFVIAGLVDEPGYVSWAQIRELAEAGVVIGSHTLSHRNLAQLDRETAMAELQQSRQILEERLGAPVRTLAYPFGTRRAFNAETLHLARASGYSFAFTSQHGSASAGADAMAISRVKVEGGDSPELFRGICCGAMNGWRLVDRWLSLLQRPQRKNPQTIVDGPLSRAAAVTDKESGVAFSPLLQERQEPQDHQ